MGDVRDKLTFLFLARISRVSRFLVFVVVALTIQAPEFLVHTILRRGVDFAFYFDAFSEVDEEAYFDAGGLQVVDELGTVSWMQVFVCALGVKSTIDLCCHVVMGDVACFTSLLL